MVVFYHGWRLKATEFCTEFEKLACLLAVGGYGAILKETVRPMRTYTLSRMYALIGLTISRQLIPPL
jgi:hypothetical protein